MKQHSIQYNFIMNFILQASTIVFPLITVPYVSRTLLPPGTGKVAWAISIVAYFIMIAMLGMPTYGIKAVAQVKENKEKLNQTVIELLSINLVMTVIAYLFFFAALALVPRMSADKNLLIICSSAILLNSLGVMWFYQGMEQYGYIAWASIFFKVLALVLMFLCIHSPEDYLWYGVTSTLSAYGSNLVNFIRLPFYISFKSVKKFSIAIHLRAVLTFFAMSVATTVYTNLDTVMVGFIKGDYETGLYNEAVKIKALLVSLITSLGAVLLPRMSYYYIKDQMDAFYRLLSKAVSFVLMASLPTATFCLVYAPLILWILSGEPYVAAAPAMMALMPTVLLIGLSNMTGIQVLVPMGKESKVLVSVGAGAIFNLAINAVLIPALGALGAALATLMAEALVLSIQVFYLRKELSQVKGSIEWKPVLLSYLLALPFLGVSFFTFLNPYVRFVLGGAAYFLVYGILLILFKEEIIIGVLNKLPLPAFLKRNKKGV